MPYPNESSCTLKSAKSFDRVRRDNSKNPNILLGFKGDKGEVISFRYPTSHWSIARARQHCSRHGGTFEAATGSQREELSHNSNLSESEPRWQDIDQEKLPDLGFADAEDRRFAHHWVENPNSVDEEARYTGGLAFLHRGGLMTAWAAANDAKGVSPSTIRHLQTHCEELGLTGSQASQAAAVFEVLQELPEEIILIDEIVSVSEEGITFNLPAGYKSIKKALEKALESNFSEMPEIVEEEDGVAVFRLKLEPVISFPEPAKETVVESVVEVVDLTLPDHEPLLENVLEGLDAPDGVAGCERGLFAVAVGEEVEFIYQTQISGIVEDGEGRPGIYPTSPSTGRLRWLAEVDGEKVVFGISLPVSRLEEPDPLLSAVSSEPIAVSYIRPPQDQTWFVQEGYVEAGGRGATKNRGSCYLKEDTGILEFKTHQVGYHELTLQGERLNGTWALELIPGLRGAEWSISRIED